MNSLADSKLKRFLFTIQKCN